MTQEDVVDKLWVGYAQWVLFKPKIFWDLKSANEWVQTAPRNFGKCFIKQYNIAGKQEE